MIAHTCTVACGALALLLTASAATADSAFDGTFYRGKGDVEYLRLLDTSRSMFAPNPRIQSMPMLYSPAWDGFVEGPTWGAWWIQNSYGTTYCALPFFEEPYLTFLQSAQDLWFDQMGDGKRVGFKGWVAPDGCLCDCASPGWIVYRQGDGRTEIHDWAMEFTAAGLLMQSELLLISRDKAAISHYLPKLERCAAFIETRRDPRNDLFLAGPAANLLAPSYAGWKKPDGTYGKAYLTGLSVTYIAALDRLIEVEKLDGRNAQAVRYAAFRRSAKKGLAGLTTPDGYLVKSMDPDGTQHGVYGAPKHGYFEAPPNHDAVAFRVVSDAQARRIYVKIASIPGLRPHAFLLPNYPSYDDMYEKPEGIWAYGTWVNGGDWSTCEARAVLMYSRLGQYADIERSLRQLMTFAVRFRMDNPLTKCGSDVYQPKEPINLCYDTFGPAAGAIRGLFEYLYRADALTLIPHIPPSITQLDQRFPARFGTKQLYLATTGHGAVTSVTMNGRPWKHFDAKSIALPYAGMPENAVISIGLGGARPRRVSAPRVSPTLPAVSAPAGAPDAVQALVKRSERARALYDALASHGQRDTYETAHARLIVEWAAATCERVRLEAGGELPRLPEPSQSAADKSYIDAGNRLIDGLAKIVERWRNSPAPARQAAFDAWNAASR